MLDFLLADFQRRANDRRNQSWRGFLKLPGRAVRTHATAVPADISLRPISTAAATSALRPMPPLQWMITLISSLMRSTSRAINSSKARVSWGRRLSVC